MKSSHLLILLLAAGLVLCGGPARAQTYTYTTTTTHPYQGVTRLDIAETSPQTNNIHILEINLNAPGIHFEMSPTTNPGGTTTSNGNAYPNTNTPQQTQTFMHNVGAQFAINTEFFINPNGGATPLFGFAASDGNVYSPFQATNGNMYAIVPDAPAINIASNNTAQIVTSQPANVYNALAGSAQIITNGAVTIPTYSDSQGSGVLTDGSGYSNTNSWYANGHYAARTAIGLSQDDKTLYLFTVDGASGSQGMTVTDMANFLDEQFGVYNALNLDGGGSTTMSWVNPATGLPGDINISDNSGGDRYVGASLAVFASPTPEPGTITLLLAAGLGIVLAAARRRNRHPSL
jgi:exopolysaccharide biosynthesis protein